MNIARENRFWILHFGFWIARSATSLTASGATGSNPKSRIQNPTSPRRGFTLIEAIIALVVLGIAIPPMLWSIREANFKRVGPMMVSKARWLATEKLEDIIADRHSSTRGYSYLNTSNYAAESSISGFPGFTRSVSLTETTANLSTVLSGGGYMKVTVSVTWTDSVGVSRTLSISTVLTDYT